MKKERIQYLLCFIMLLMIEICIAVYVHDQFIRPYIGDILVVVVIYCFIRIFFPKGIKGLPVDIFLFAVVVEVLQYIHIAEILAKIGMPDNIILQTAIGATFDMKDIICYGVGCILLLGYEKMKKIISMPQTAAE